MQSEINTLYRTNKNKFKHTNLHYLVAQYIHMMMNRFFLSCGREFEMITYVILEKYYAYVINNVVENYKYEKRKSV